MKNKDRIIRWAAALAIFLVAFAALMFFLKYEGIMTYEYLFPEQPDLVLTPADADEMTVEQDSAYATAYARNKSMTFHLERQDVGTVRIHYANQMEPYTTAMVHYTLSDTGETYSQIGVNRRDCQEIVFTIPQHEYDQIRIEANDLIILEKIDVYAQWYYADASKQIPKMLNLGISLLFSLLLSAAFICSNVDLQSGKKLGFPALYLMLEIAALRLCLQARSYEEYSMTLELIILAAFALLSVVLFAVYRMLFITRMPLHRVFLLCAAALGTVFVFLTQPYVVPDEGTHFAQAYMLFSKHESGYDIRQEDWRFREKNEKELGIKSTYKRYAILLDEAALWNQSGEEVTLQAKKENNVPLGHIATGIAVQCAKMLNLSGIALFYFGRLVNMLVYCAMMALTIYLIPVGKAAVMCLALSPVSLQQAASYSYDPIVMALAFVFTAYVLRLWDQKKTISLRQFCVLCLLGMLLAPSKIAYVPMVLTVFLIPTAHYGFGKRKWVYPMLTVVLAVAALIYVQADTVNASVAMDSSMPVSTYTVSSLVKDIRGAINVFLCTFEVKSDFYYNYLFCRNLGWHQLHAYAWLSALLLLVFVLGCQQMQGERLAPLGVGKRWGVLLALLMTVGLILISMLLAWTKQGNPYIEGVQGRYFIPALILLIPILRNSQITISETANRWCAMLPVWGCILTMIRVLQVMPAV